LTATSYNSNFFNFSFFFFNLLGLLELPTLSLTILVGLRYAFSHALTTTIPRLRAAGSANPCVVLSRGLLSYGKKKTAFATLYPLCMVLLRHLLLNFAHDRFCTRAWTFLVEIVAVSL
jgi:hypothetical protein